jgi:histidine triad (HIT) family protein
MTDSSSGCLFCKLDEPTVTVYRDATVQAFISLAPINRYHVIVAPRAHFEHLTELPALALSAAV